MAKIDLLKIAILIGVALAVAAVHRFSIEDLPTLDLVRAPQDSAAGAQAPTDPAPQGQGASGSLFAEPEPLPEQTAGVVLLITVRQARRLYDGGEAQFIDARNRPDFEFGHVPGAFSLPYSEFASGRPAALDLLIAELAAVIYCEGGECESSRLVAQQLTLYGFQRISIVEEGFPGWEAAGHPTEAGGAP